jgi:DmsE family decaheme c-type cytochrome
MTTTRLRHWLPALGVLLSLTAPIALAADEAVVKKDLVLKGDAICTRCHDETESYPVLSIGKTRHRSLTGGSGPTCTSCHGESRRHVTNERAAGVRERPKPDRSFAGLLLATPDLMHPARFASPGGQRSTTPVAEQNGACMSCHQGGMRLHWQGSVHDRRDVACTSCHQIHTQHDRVRERRTQPQVCFTCHKEQRSQVARTSHHPILEGKVSCSDCHNPHGAAGPKLLVRDSVVDTCYTCHTEKRGPFVFNHQPVTEDCAICHNPHGTINASLLKSRPPFLCQQCHEPTSHRGNIPGLLAGTGNAAGTRGLAQARSCLNCHTNIHGGNNPLNNAESRSLRR